MKTPLLAMIFMSLMAVSNAQDIVKPVFWLTWDQHQGFIDKGTGNSSTLFVDSSAVYDSSVVNFNAAYTFRGTGNNITVSNLFVANPKVTIMVAYMPDSLAQDNPVYSLKHDTSDVAILAPKWISRYGRNLGFADSVQVKAHINVLESQIRGGSAHGYLTELSIAELTGSYFTGSIAELLVFEGKLNKPTREKYETYLAIKYGVTLEGDRYLAFNDSVLWNRNGRGLYHHDILGIARDSALNLNQKQSQNSEVVIAATNKVKANDANVTVLPENSYLLMGATAGAIANFSVDTLNANMIYAISAKRWLVSLYNDSMRFVNTQFIIQDEGLLGSDSLFLIIQRDETPSYDILFPDSIDAEGKIYFNGITWDIDGSGSDIVRLATFPQYAQTSSQRPGSNSFNNEANDSFMNRDSSSANRLQLFGYPNPTNDEFHISVMTSSIEQTEITITDVTGRVYFLSKQEGQNFYNLQGPQLSPGTYFIKASSIAGVKFTKLIIY